MITTGVIMPGDHVGLCPDAGHYARTKPEVCESGRLALHPAALGSDTECPGSGRLSRHVGLLPGYLIKEDRPGSLYVIWNRKLMVPVGILTGADDASSFGYTDWQIGRADSEGRSASKGPMCFSQPGIHVGDVGWLERRNLVPFTVSFLRGDDEVARQMLGPVPVEFRRREPSSV